MASLVLATYVMFSRFLWADNYFDLYAGRYIAHHGIPHRNVVTLVSHGAPWVDQQWLAHVVFYGAWTIGGYPAVAVLSAGLITLALTVLAVAMKRRGVPGPRVFIWAIAALLVCFGNAEVFAQCFAYPLFTAALWLILADEREDRLAPRTWLVVPVLAVWANTHGSVVLGAGLVALYAAYRAVRALLRHDTAAVPGYAALAIAAGLAVFCTPYGTGVIRYYRSLIGNPVVARYVAEWAPPTVRDPFSWTFFALVLAVLIAVMVAWRRGAVPSPVLGTFTAVLLVLALAAVRNAPWFTLAGSLLAAETVARSTQHRSRALRASFRRLVAGLLVTLALASLAVLAVTPTSQFESLISHRAIDKAAAMAARKPGTYVLGDAYSAPAMLWLHPAMWGRVGYDSRFEQYSRADLNAYLSFAFGRSPGWQRVLKGYTFVVASRSADPQLARALSRLPGWRVVYRDRSGLVLERG